jgi:tRNA pseudouridine38-40 synthase
LKLNYKITLSYDGTDFAGFQAQDPARFRTVQIEVEKALLSLHGETHRTRIAAASRTDQGVHALGQVISVELPRAWSTNELARALNAVLPPDIRALDSALVPSTFHARRSALSKRYRYDLDVGGVQHPARRWIAGHTFFELDRGRVEEAAVLYLGEHDFASLQTAGSDVTTTVRRVTTSSVTWTERQDGSSPGRTLTYVVEADGFLRRMVRSMVGGLVAAGRGGVTIDDLKRAIDARDRRAWKPAPADSRGLYLLSVLYAAKDDDTGAGPESRALLESEISR